MEGDCPYPTFTYDLHSFIWEQIHASNLRAMNLISKTKKKGFTKIQ